MAKERAPETVLDFSHNGQRTTAECLHWWTAAPNAAAVAQAWYNSPPHYELITIPGYTRAAVACWHTAGRSYYVYVAEG